MLVPVIIAGGSGVRLWPASRALLPKQFMDFPGREGSLFQDTLRRLKGLASTGSDSISPPLVVCNDAHDVLVAGQMEQAGVKRSAILLEPVGRGTAPAVALAALFADAVGAGPDSVLLVLPADHVIERLEAFHAAVAQGMKLAQQGKLVTFGVSPTSAETGYGYIERGEALGAPNEGKAFAITRFTEKPDASTAQEHFNSGRFFWNSGMFMFRADRYLQALQKFVPAIYAACKKVKIFEDDFIVSGHKFLRLRAVGGRSPYADCPSDSIDYAIMEKVSEGENGGEAVVVLLDAGWSDVGSWDALWQTRNDKDAAGNMLVENAGKVMAKDVHNSYIASHSRLVAAVGVENLIVVETPDAILVAQKGRSQEVKDIVTRLQKEGREEVHRPHLVPRPWGSYEVLGKGEGYQVKHLTVEPGAALSLQKHKHRAERWTVIAGEAQVTCDEKQFKLAVGESTTIPQGSEHRLENPGKEPLRIVEVQTGDYLGEDDIVRLEDKYGRI